METQAIVDERPTVKDHHDSYGSHTSAYPLSVRYLFQTGRGTVGLLQITGFTGNPPGVKIRYRLVRLAGLESSLESLIEEFIKDEPESVSPSPPPEITKEYQQRGEVWLYPVARRDELPAGNLFYLVRRKVFYIEWNPGVSANSHFYGPFTGNPASVFGTALSRNKLN